MAKPGPRTSYHTIIDKPELKSPLRNLMEGSITLALWAVWLYWLLPLITLIAWIFGLKHYVSQVIADSTVLDLLRVIKDGGIGILIITLITYSWILYNVHFVFKRKGYRRQEVRPCSNEDMASYSNVDPEQLEKAKLSNKINITVKDNKILIAS